MPPQDVDIQSILSPGLIWAIVGAIVLGIVGTALIWFIRRWSRQADAPPMQGFTLSDLRKLRKEGKMTADEFQRAAQAMMSHVRSAQPPAPLPRADKKTGKLP